MSNPGPLPMLSVTKSKVNDEHPGSTGNNRVPVCNPHILSTPSINRKSSLQKSELENEPTEKLRKSTDM